LAIAVPLIVGIVFVWKTRSSPDPEILWKQAVADLQAGRWRDARAGLERIERLRPATPREWALRAEIAEAEGDTPAALASRRTIPWVPRCSTCSA
jgi:hypothetical protein